MINKKKYILIIIVFLSLFFLIGCKTIDTTEVKDSRFFVVEKGYEKDISYNIIVDKETNVMYMVYFKYIEYPTITLLVDEHGNPLLYNKGE